VKKLLHYLFSLLGKKIIDINNINEIQNLINKLKPKKSEFNLIRIGSSADGGYLLPDDMEGIKYCFSPGVSDNSSFELELAKKYNIKSFLCDASVDKMPSQNKNLNFLKKHLGVSNDSKFLTLDEWVKNTDISNKSILQMDIEGSEYPVILNTSSKVLSNFRIIIIEFHDLDLIFNNFGFLTIDSTFRKILKNFIPVHLHPNNCCGYFQYNEIKVPKVIEFTFINKSRVNLDKIIPISDPYHVLDQDNTVNKKLILPDNWINFF
tara:strand:+ start:64 stop:855 length:792 start_codon:yes stop_codon:yes gene_type:complete